MCKLAHDAIRATTVLPACPRSLRWRSARSLIVALGCASTAAATLLASSPAAAQGKYPERPIRLIIPVAPGGGSDNLARTMLPGLMESLGERIVIDNRPGGSSVIGTDLAAKAAPDGYTLLQITTTHTVSATLIPNLPYDPVKDFAPVALTASQSNILVVPSSLVKSVKELIALAKSKPNTLTFASGGIGSSPHLTGETFKLLTGISITHIPYKGTGPAVAALLGAQVQMLFVGPLAVEGFIKAGRLRPLAVTSAQRSPMLPDVPTMAEAGGPPLETGTWYGLVVPARTPQPVIATLHAATMQTLNSPDVRTRLLAQGVAVIGTSPQEFGAYIKSEVAKWAKVIKEAKVRVE